MRIEYYAFALFIAALVCLIAILFKLLFSNVRRQNKLLDEKEARLLQLYRSVEGIMDEFNEQIRVAIDDIKDRERLAAARLSTLLEQQAAPAQVPQRAEAGMAAVPQRAEAGMAPEGLAQRPAKAMTVDSSRLRAASEVLERAERMIKSKPAARPSPPAIAGGGQAIQRIFDDAPDGQRAGGADAQGTNSRKESILALAGEGKTDAQIARELGITQNEVKLVIGLTQA